MKKAIPDGYYGIIVVRSGIGKKYGVIVHNGTIDSDYCGIVGVILFNFSNYEYVIESGDLITQMIIEHCYSPKFVEVSELLRKKLKEGRVVLVQKVSDAFVVLFLF